MAPTNQLSCLSGLQVSQGLQEPCLGLQKGFCPLSCLPWSQPWPCQSHLVGVQDREDDEVLGLPVTERRNEDGQDLMVMDLNTCNWLPRAHPTLPAQWWPGPLWAPWGA